MNKPVLVTGEIYHIYTRSIAEFRIFRSSSCYKRMIELFWFYNVDKNSYKFSTFLRFSNSLKEKIRKNLANQPKIVKIIAYCLMPTHIHLILQQLEDNGISKFMNVILKSYSKYFNVKFRRLGPLWESRFKRVLVKTDEQLLHLTRYIHLNPVSVSLVNNPCDWEFSSYNEYIGKIDRNLCICNFADFLDISPVEYQKFVEERIDYQRELEKIKHLLLEPY